MSDDTLRRFTTALLLLPFLLFPLAQERLTVFGVPIYTLEWIVAISAAVYVVAKWSGAFPWRPIPKAIVFPVVFLFLAASAALFLGDADREGLGILKSWFFLPLSFAFLLTQVFGRRDMERATALWFLGASAVALAALSLPAALSETYDGRLRSVYPSPNHLALFLVPAAILGAYLVLRGIRAGFGNVFLFSALFLGVSTLLVLVRTESLGGVVAAFSGIAVFFVLASVSGPFARKVMAAVFIVYLATPILWVSSLDWERLGSGEIRTPIASRVMIWNASLEMIREHPILGTGPGNFQETYLALQPMFPPYLEWAVPHPHGIFLAFWLSTGLFGLIAFLWLTFSVFRIIIRSFLSSDTTEERLLPALLFSLLFSILVHGLVDTPYFKNDLAFIFWSIVAFAATSFQAERK